MKEKIELTTENIHEMVLESVKKILETRDKWGEYVFNNLDNYFNSSKEFQKDSDFDDMEVDQPENIGPRGKGRYKNQGKLDSLDFISNKNKDKEWHKNELCKAKMQKEKWLNHDLKGKHDKTDNYFN